MEAESAKVLSSAHVENEVLAQRIALLRVSL
jgi:hypothetical protein